MSNIVGYLNLYDSPSLGELTSHRTPGSTSFIGRYALMDFALSNFTNSNITNINILVKDNFRSVAKHCGSLKSWVRNTKRGKQNFLINERGIADSNYNSDLNAIRENDWVLYDANADYIIVQPAHIVTVLNLTDLISKHISSGADITMVYKSINDGNKSFLSSHVLSIDGDKIVGSEENSGKKAKVDISLRTYIFSRDIFYKILRHKDYRNALSLRMLLQKIINEKSADIRAYKYQGYARCFDSFEHFMEYSFELLKPEVASSLFKDSCNVYTISRNTPPSIYGEKAKVTNCFVANGANINGEVKNSIISRYVKVEEGAKIKNSIILTRTVIKKGAVIENALVDKYSTISGKVIGTKNKPIYIEQGKTVK